MSKKKTIIVVAVFSLFFSVIFEKALHQHSHSGHVDNKKTVSVSFDTVFIDSRLKMIDIYFLGK